MKRGPLIHGVLLVFALGFAYQSYTREDKIEPKTGTIKVWSIPADSITAITYDTPNKTTSIEKRTADGASYWWGKETRTMTKKVKKPELPPTPDGEVPEAVEETKTINDEYAVGSRADDLAKHMADLRALRVIAELSEEKKKEYGLDTSSNNILVAYAGGTKTLVVGAKVFGTRDRFVTDVETNKAYAISGDVLGNLLQGQSGLQIRKYHAYRDDDVAKATVRAGETTNELNRLTVEAEGKSGRKTKTWARATSPDKPDQTMANFLDRVGNLRGLSYEEEVVEQGMTQVFRIDYKNAAGQTLGWFEMFEKPPPAPEPAAPADPNATPDGQAPAGKDDQAPAGKDDQAPAGKDDKTPTAKDDNAKDGKAPAAKDDKTPAVKDDKTPAAKDDKKPAAKDDKAKDLKSTYYMRTERTRLFMLLSQESATRVVQDVESILAGQ